MSPAADTKVSTKCCLDVWHIYIYIYIIYMLDEKSCIGRKKAVLDEASAESNIVFLRPVYSILDGKASNILYIILYTDDMQQIWCHSSSFLFFFLNFRHLARLFVPSQDVRKPTVRWPRWLGACGLVSKLSNITYIGRFSQNCPVSLFVKEIWIILSDHVVQVRPFNWLIVI